MPKSKLHMSISADNAVPPDSDTSEDSPSSSPSVTPTYEKTSFPRDGSPPNFTTGTHPTGIAAGRLPEEVYTNTLPAWRAALRQRCVKVVEWESQVLGRWQARVRTPWLDTYFLQTSMLGTHTFFLLFLPCLFFFGHHDLGRGLCYALAFGLYSSSFLKDLVCSPRPFAPPVTRLTIGSHHLEYGFPSTHSTNSMSITLFLGSHIYDLHRAGSISTTTFVAWNVGFVVYMLSILGGRLYMGMHGFLDCSAGLILGVVGWVMQRLLMPAVEKWLAHSDWNAPLTVTAVCLLLVNQHPSPVDDCPCFEDAIAFVSVVLGLLISVWCSHRVPALDPARFTTVTPGAALDSPAAAATWTLFVLLKLTTGIAAVFGWRMLAKPSVQTLLPPLFRWLARASPVRLPHRRHYTPATEYSHGPPHTLRAVPSMIDLDLATGEVVDGVASGLRGRAAGAVKRRGAGGEKVVTFEANEGGAQDDRVKHYDADVLTRVVVYAGIGIVSCMLVPAMFEALEWGF
ncbi:hypothetical protein BC834DRAFT_904558 [Gloeopeniophorella convolvens]|nr:hypothetical protein BC834DRAFT_904558 [Gloeopeniophorella convolvens]